MRKTGERLATMTTRTAKKTAAAPKKARKKHITYHHGAFSAISFLLRDYVKNGDITLDDEHPLSKSPLLIDIIVIKKNRDVKIDREWGRIFRAHNIIEYKSPAESPLSRRVFDKVLGYAGIYAWQYDVKLTDMTATIVCFKKPTALFKTLSEEFDYEILRKYDGIYYITQRGGAAHKSLAIQIVVSSELPDSELILKGLRAEIDEATLRKMAVFSLTNDEESRLLLSYWGHVVAKLNPIILKLFNEEGSMRFATDEELEKILYEIGVGQRMEKKAELRGMEKGMEKGMQKGMQQLLRYWERGHSLEEARAKFAMA